MSLLNISKKPISILKKSSISEVIKKLLEYNLSRLIVVEDGKPVGIITEKDVGLFLFSETTRQGLWYFYHKNHETNFICEWITISRKIRRNYDWTWS